MKITNLLSLKFLLFTIIILNLSSTFAQFVSGLSSPTQEQLWISGHGKPPVPPDFDTKLGQNNSQKNPNTFYRGKNGKSMISGSVFLFDSARLANVELYDSSTFFKMPIKLNLYTHEISYNFNGVERIASPILFKSIKFLKEKSDSVEIVFKSGFEDKKEMYKNYLFEVLSEGKFTLLNNKHVIVVGSRSEISNDYIGTFRGANDIYVYLNKNLEKAKLTKTFFFDRFKESKLSIMQKFVTDNFIDFKKIDDLKMLVSYYNNLAK